VPRSKPSDGLRIVHDLKHWPWAVRANELPRDAGLLMFWFAQRWGLQSPLAMCDDSASTFLALTARIGNDLHTFALTYCSFQEVSWCTASEIIDDWDHKKHADGIKKKLHLWHKLRSLTGKKCDSHSAGRYGNAASFDTYDERSTRVPSNNSVPFQCKQTDAVFKLSMTNLQKKKNLIRRFRCQK
jgi:hypothetical protein